MLFTIPKAPTQNSRQQITRIRIVIGTCKTCQTPKVVYQLPTVVAKGSDNVLNMLQTVRSHLVIARPVSRVKLIARSGARVKIWFCSGKARVNLMRLWLHDKIIARFSSKSDLTERSGKTIILECLIVQKMFWEEQILIETWEWLAAAAPAAFYYTQNCKIMLVVYP